MKKGKKVVIEEDVPIEVKKKPLKIIKEKVMVTIINMTGQKQLVYYTFGNKKEVLCFNGNQTILIESSEVLLDALKPFIKRRILKIKS
jgi:hypothetical protein